MRAARACPRSRSPVARRCRARHGWCTRARADADQHTGSARAHQVQRSLVRGAAAHDHRDVELADEPLQVQGLDRLRDVLRRHDRALDHEKVELGGDDRCGELLGALRRDARARHDAGITDLTDAGRHQLGLDRLAVDVLHAQRRLLGAELGDLGEEWLRIFVARPQALEVEHADAAEPTDLDRGVRRDHTVHRGTHQRQLEAEGVDLPRDVDILGIARASTRHDRDVVEPVRAAARLPQTDLHLSHAASSCR